MYGEIGLETFGVSSLNEEITCKCEETCKVIWNKIEWNEYNMV